MITYNAINKFAEKIWNSQVLQKCYLTNEPEPDLHIPLRKLSAKEIQASYTKIKEWVYNLKEYSKEKRGIGYQVEYAEIHHRQFGRQLIPKKIFFENSVDLLQYIKKSSEFNLFKESVDVILKIYPELKSWLCLNPEIVLKYAEIWPKLLDVCNYFIKNPKANKYLRELDISNVESKFIEQHKPILHDLFSQLLPTFAIDQSIQSIRGAGFEQRYYLKFDEPSIRFRILDPSLFLPNNLSDLSIPRSDFEKFNFLGKFIFITENKINGLSFPNVPSSLVIFGLGYGIQILKDIEWLHSKTIIYWGDIDTHGFIMLSQLRGYYPQTQSMLMDEITLINHKHLWVLESSQNRAQLPVLNLTEAEHLLYQQLQNHSFGDNIRLEQERISHNFLRYYGLRNHKLLELI